VGADTHHRHRHHPLRPGGRHRLGRALPAADPPRGLGRPPRRAPDHRRHPDSAPGRASARRPRPETGLAVVFCHRRHRLRHQPLVAGVPTPVRPRTHLPAVQTDPGLDHPEDPHPRRSGPLDLADHRRAHPATTGPAAGCRSPTAPGKTRRPRPADPRKGPTRVSPPPREHQPSYRCTETLPTRPRPPTRLPQPTPRHPLRRGQTRHQQHDEPHQPRSNIKLRGW
jgi:hypothetical protein